MPKGVNVNAIGFLSVNVSPEIGWCPVQDTSDISTNDRWYWLQHPVTITGKPVLKYSNITLNNRKKMSASFVYVFVTFKD